MPRRFWISVLGALCAVVFPARSAEPAEASQAARLTNEFGLRFLREGTVPGENAIFSPLSIQLSLAVLYAGTEGTTRAEMRTVLGYPGTDFELHRSFAALRALLGAAAPGAAEAKEELLCASGLFVQQGFEVKPGYLALLAKFYGAAPQSIDFRGSPAAAAKAMNDWIGKATRGRFDSLVAPTGDFAQTKLSAVDAIHFKSRWQTRLLTAEPLPFRRPGAAPKEVRMMEIEQRLPYRKYPTFSAAKLPFLAEFDFVILLPDQVDGLPELERSLPATVLSDAFERPLVELTLPPFRHAPPTLGLTDLLRRMGLRSVFDAAPVGGADLRRIAAPTAEGALVLSDIWHRAKIEVTRFGAEATAVTVKRKSAKSSQKVTPTPIPRVELKIDHPFLFAIVHRATSAALFLGRVEKLPSLEEASEQELEEDMDDF